MPLPLFGLIRSLAIYYNPVRVAGMRRFYAGLLAPGDLAFDVGAHVGSRTRAMRAAGARVVAVEPQHPFAGFLRRTLPRDVVLVEAAAGPREEMAEMAVSTLHPTVSSLRTSLPQDTAEAPGWEDVTWDRRQKVRVTTLDRLIADHGLPKLVKIDVEGFELDVLSGLSRPVPMVSVEYLPAVPKLTFDVLDRLAALGSYRFNVAEGESGAFLWPDWRTGQQVKDWLAALPASARSGDIYARLQG